MNRVHYIVPVVRLEARIERRVLLLGGRVYLRLGSDHVMSCDVLYVVKLATL